MSDALSNSTLPGQISRFAAIGILATIVHVVMASLFHYGIGFSPLVANLGGFFCAFIPSFAGHYFWTFEKTSDMRRAMPRFFLVAILGLCLNQAIVWLVVHVLDQSFALAMALGIVIIPATSFVLSKFWAFRAAS